MVCSEVAAYISKKKGLIDMEGFWEAMTYAEEHYKVMENFYDNTNDYIIALEKLIDLCYADGRAPTAEEVAIIDNFWNGD